jgi:DNA-binding PadR family transcriptional regulator
MRYTTAAYLVMYVMASRPDDAWYGWEIRQAVILPSGTLVNLLRKLVNNGYLTVVDAPGRPTPGRPRVYYKMTDLGRELAREAVSRIRDLPTPSIDFPERQVSAERQRLLRLVRDLPEDQVPALLASIVAIHHYSNRQ